MNDKPQEKIKPRETPQAWARRMSDRELIGRLRGYLGEVALPKAIGDEIVRRLNVFRGMTSADLGLDAVPAPARAPSATAGKGLTEPQLEELRRLARGPQNTYGKSRARVQRNLYGMGLALFTHEDGRPYPYIEGAPQCRITDHGLLAAKVKKS